MVKLSTHRVQDWIDSVINPVLTRLQRASRLLPHGPWEIHANSRRLETIARVHDAVLIHYHDNIDDFVSHRKRFKKLFDAYDLSIDTLESAVSHSFAVLLEHAAARGDLPQSVDKIDGWKYLCSYAAANFREIPGSWFNAELYNATLGEQLRSLAAKEIAHAEEVGTRAAKQCEVLMVELAKERRSLADKYQARVKPVGEFSLG